MQSVWDAGATQHPGHEAVAVRAGPVPVLLALRITFRIGEHAGDARRLVAGPGGREPRGAAADAVGRSLEVAVHMAIARAARVLRLPYFPAVAGAGVFEDDEPVMHGNR